MLTDKCCLNISKHFQTYEHNKEVENNAGHKSPYSGEVFGVEIWLAHDQADMESYRESNDSSRYILRLPLLDNGSSVI